MAKLTKADVAHVAKLAKLKLTNSELNKFLTQLSSIISYIEELQNLDTAKVEATSQTTGLENIIRNDVIDTTSVLSQSEALSGIDSSYNGYFKVPMILEGRTDK